MTDFNPDEYLKSGSSSDGAFDPDAYLGSQKQKPGFFKSLAMDLYHSSPEIIGNTVGSALVAPLAAPVAAANPAAGLAIESAGAGAGQATGRAFKNVWQEGSNLIDTIKGQPDTYPDAPHSPLAAAKDIGMEGLKGAATPVVGKLVVQPLMKAAGKVISAVTPDGLADIAQNAGTRALGFTKRFLKDGAARMGAKADAQLMLDNGIIKPLSEPEEMAAGVKDLMNKSGQGIGDYLNNDATGVFNPKDAIEALNSLRPEQRGGAYDTIHGIIDNAIDTIKAHGNKPMGFAEANQLKGVLQSLANFAQSGGEKNVNNQVAGVFRGSLDKALENRASLEDSIASKFKGSPQNEAMQKFQQFLGDKNTYRATNNVEDALNNRLSSELGNRRIGLTDLVTVGAKAADGDLAGASKVLLAKKILDKYGNTTVASGADALSKGLNSMPMVKAGLNAADSATQAVINNPTAQRILRAITVSKLLGGRRGQ